MEAEVPDYSEYIFCCPSEEAPKDGEIPQVQIPKVANPPTLHNHESDHQGRMLRLERCVNWDGLGLCCHDPVPIKLSNERLLTKHRSTDQRSCVWGILCQNATLLKQWIRPSAPNRARGVREDHLPCCLTLP